MFKTYITLLFIVLSTAVFADTSILRVDENRGPWTDTIDLDASVYAYTRVTDNVYKGATALRFELRDGDCFTAYPADPASGWDDCTRDRERTEVRERWDAPLDTSMWYSVNLFIPNDYVPMYPKQMFLQWHNGIWGPNLYMHLNENKLHVDILTEPGQTTTQYTFGTDILTLGEWHTVVVNVIWTNNPELGRMVIYVDGKRLVQHYGPTVDAQTYLSGHGPHTKYGIYRSHLFRYVPEGPHPTHVLYFDEYRRGYDFNSVDVRQQVGD